MQENSSGLQDSNDRKMMGTIHTNTNQNTISQGDIT